MKRLSKWLKRIFLLLLIFFIGSNYIMYNHAYYFTHFVPKDIPKVKSQDLNKKGFWKKLKLAIFGVEIGKPRNKETPDSTYKEVIFGQHPRLHAWWIPCNKQPKGVVIMFHGYNSCKSSQLERARIVRQLGFHTFLVDLLACFLEYTFNVITT